MKILNKIFLSIFLTLGLCARVGASVTFTGSAKKIIQETPANSTGLDAVYVCWGVSGISASYNSTSGNQVKWMRFSSLGGGFAEDVKNIVIEGSTSTLPQIEANMGYIIEDGTDREYFWIVDYLTAPLVLSGISFNPEEECGTMTINVQGSGDELEYYTINGQIKHLNREIELHYNTLEWNEEGKVYQSSEVINNVENFKSSIALQAPLCNTVFSLKGDKFLREWGEEVFVESDLFNTSAVEVKGYATQTNKLETEEGNELGGSAPAIVNFEGYCTDAVVFKEWQIAKDQNFEDILYRFNEENIEYTFNEAGAFYVRFYGANASGGCDSFSDVFSINIEESKLECPNAFSPKSDVESSRIWRVKYKSLVEFKCHIFNRYGMEVFTYSDPAQGWDGKHNGKYVKPGVYFYVIEAVGADGKEYKRKGDINIINLKQ